MTYVSEGWTKDNQRESDKKYRDSNKEKIAEKNKKWGLDNPEKLREYAKEWKNKHPEQVVAKNRLRNAIAGGKITRPNACSGCGKVDIKPDGHHPNYRDPYSVIWLCKKCHRKSRGNNGQN